MGVSENVRNVRARIADACMRSGRDPSTVELLAVTKYVSDEVIRELLDEGLTAFGENRVDQIVARMARFPQGDWHLIGSLQTNKVKNCKEVAVIHSLDRTNLADEINKRAATWSKRVDALLQVNVSGEGTKHGVSSSDLPSLAAYILDSCPNIRIRGLMTMAPLVPPEQTRSVFRRLRELRDALNTSYGWDMRVLSMGMSNDFEVAVEEGSTLVRIGSLLYGKEGENVHV